MNKNKLILEILIILIFIVSFSSVSAEDSDVGSFSDLAELINNTDSDTLELTKDYVFNNEIDTNYIKGIPINRTITINGNNHSLNGANQSRILDMDYDYTIKVVLNNIQFLDSKGAIYSTVNTLKITDSYFNNNGGSFGAISSYGRSEGLTIINSTFINNYATDQYANGGAVYGTNTTIINSTFINNSAYYGGAVQLYDGNIINCVFINNTAVEGGAYNSYFYTRVINSTFINNIASSKGGAIRGITNTTGSIFINNTAPSGGTIYSGTSLLSQSTSLTNSLLIGNTPSTDGSILYFDEEKSSVNYNIIYLSTGDNENLVYYAVRDNVSFEYNWWGVNNPKGLIFNSNNIETQIETWILANATLTEEATIINTPVDLILSLDKYYNSTTKQINKFNVILPSDTVELSVNGDKTYYLLEDNKLTIPFSESTVGEYSIETTIGRETFTNNLVITDSETDLEISIDVDELNPQVTDIITYTITVKNNGPNTAIKVQVDDTIPGGLEYISSDLDYDNITGIWNIGNLKDQESISLNLKLKVRNYGTITNKVKILTANDDTDLTNNEASITVTATSVVDLSVNIVSSKLNPQKDEEVTFTINVLNEGKLPTTNVKVNALIPTGLTYISDDSEGAYNKDTGIWTVGGVNTDTVSLNIKCMVDTEDTIYFPVSLTLEESDIHLENNENQVVINPQTDLKLSSSIDSEVDLKSRITYTLIVENTGVFDSPNTIVNIEIPNNLEFLSSNLPEEYSNKVWNLGTLSAGDSRTLELELFPSKHGTVTIKSTVSSDIKDTDESNNEVSDILKINAIVELHLTVSAPSTSIETETVSITLTISNNGPSIATNIKVENTIPTELEYVTCILSTGEYTDGVWTVDELGLDSTETITLSFKAISTGEVDFTTSISSLEKNTNTENSITKKIIINPGVDLKIEIIPFEEKVKVDDETKCNITITNKGPSRATGITATLVLNGATLVSTEATKGAYSNGRFFKGWGFNDEYLDPDESATLTITIKTITTGSINITSQIRNVVESEINREDNYAETSFTSLGIVDLSISVNTDKTSAELMGNITYLIEVKNTGEYNGENIIISLVKDDGIAYRSHELSKGTYSYTTNKWTISSLEPGKSETLNITYHITKITNIALSANLTTDSYDEDLTNNYANKTIQVSKIETLISINNIETFTNAPIMVSGSLNTVSGKIIFELYNNTNLLLSENTRLNNRGEFTVLLDSLSEGEYTGRISYTDDTQEIYSNSQKEIKITVKSQTPIIPPSPINTTNTTDTTNTTNTTVINTTNITNTTNTTIENTTNITNNTEPINNNTNITSPYTPTVTPIIVPEDLTKTYGEKGDFTGRLLDTDGTPLPGRYVSITLTRLSSGASKTYISTTDYTGLYTLEINLAPGQYKAEVSYNNLKLNNITYAHYQRNSTIIIKSQNSAKNGTILIQEDLNKNYGVKEDFTGVLYTETGDTLPGRYVELTLTRLSSGASKTYISTTDYTGLYRLEINLAHGEYSIIAKYSDDNYETSTSKNTIRIY